MLHNAMIAQETHFYYTIADHTIADCTIADYTIADYTTLAQETHEFWKKLTASGSRTV